MPHWIVEKGSVPEAAWFGNPLLYYPMGDGLWRRTWHPLAETRRKAGRYWLPQFARCCRGLVLELVVFLPPRLARCCWGLVLTFDFLMVLPSQSRPYLPVR